MRARCSPYAGRGALAGKVARPARALARGLDRWLPVPPAQRSTHLTRVIARASTRACPQIIGGYLLGALFNAGGTVGFWGSIVVAFIGAAVLLSTLITSAT